LGQYSLLGDTLDDAVGEAFDKTAKLMGIAYPGGPELAKLADKASISAIDPLPPFPRPMTDRPGLNFSFSGLKTHALMAWQKSLKDERAQLAIAQGFQDAIVDTLIIKCRRALQQTGARQLVVAGGVAANKALRIALEKLITEFKGRIYFPSLEYCTDNGAMIAYAGYLHFSQGQQDLNLSINVRARWPLMDPQDKS
jgi:N6-L-threonylcarbamoyladenine synthase